MFIAGDAQQLHSFRKYQKETLLPSHFGDDHFGANLMETSPQILIFEAYFDIRIRIAGSGATIVVGRGWAAH